MLKITLKFLLFSLISHLVVFTSCLDEDPCPGEPEVIEYNEIVALRFRTANDGNPFDTTMYKLDSLIIIENSDTLKFNYTSVGNDSIIKFVLNSFAAPKIWSHFDSLLTSEIIFHFDSINIDTLHINIQPKEVNLPCNSTWYESSRIVFNSQLIKETSHSSCYICGDTLTLYLNDKVVR